MLRDKNAERSGHLDDCHHSITPGESALVEEAVELQPLMPESRRYFPRSPDSATRSKQALRVVSAENNLKMETGNVLESGRGIEAHPLLPSLPISENVATTDDVSRNSIVASVDSAVYAGHKAMSERDGDAESQRLITMVHAEGKHSMSTVRILDADETDDRLQAARKLEDGLNSEEDEMRFRLKISRSKIRWGVVCMPKEFYAQFRPLQDGVKLGHLAFGIEE